MLQIIGLMLAAYILTRCVEISHHQSPFVRAHAALTYLWTLVCVLILLFSGLLGALPHRPVGMP